jgi:Cft2 family RNA processing exonuclease
MVQVRTEANNIKVCTRKGDELRIGKAKLERIEYIFWMNKFCEVYIILRSAENWKHFKEAIFETFGKGISLAEIGKIIGGEEHKEIESYYWSGRKTSMMLNYGRDNQLGDLLMESLFIEEQKKVYEQQKRIEQEKKATERKARERGF